MKIIMFSYCSSTKIIVHYIDLKETLWQVIKKIFNLQERRQKYDSYKKNISSENHFMDEPESDSDRL